MKKPLNIIFLALLLISAVSVSMQAWAWGGKDTGSALTDKDTNFDKLSFRKFNVEMDASTIASNEIRKIVFYVRQRQAVKTVGWEMYVFKAKIKNWSEEEASRWALTKIDGKGVPPINIVWDGIDTKGNAVPKGKYYCILMANDIDGNNYTSEWFGFNIK